MAQSKPAIGYFGGDKTQEAKVVHVLIIGYAFKKVKDKIDRTNCLQKDLDNIETTFSKYQCKFHKLLGHPKKQLFGSQNERGTLEEAFDNVTGKVELLIVFVLTHGGKGGMICTHKEEFHKSELWNKIETISSLKEALKIYFMEPCRGGDRESRFLAGNSLPRLGNMTFNPNITNEPAKTDHAVFYATVEGQTAIFCDDGTRLVIATCWVLNNLGEEDVELEVFFTRIVGQIVDQPRENMSQTAEWCLFPTKQFTFRTLTGIDALTNKAKMKNPARRGYFDWTTEKGDDLGPGRAFIFYDDSHKNDADEFYKIFKDKLYLEVHRPIEVKRMLDELYKITKYLDDEGLLLICVLCKLEVSNGEIALKYASNCFTNNEHNVARAIGYFSSQRCPAMNGKPKVYILLDNTSQLDSNQDSVTPTNCGNNHSGSICFIGQGPDVTKAFKAELQMGYLSNGLGSIQKMFAKVANATKDRVKETLMREDAQTVLVPETISRMPFLVDFPNVSPIYSKPTFLSTEGSGEFSREILVSFDSLCQETLAVMQKTNSSKVVYLLSCDPGTGKTRATKELTKYLRKNDIKVAVIYAKKHVDEFTYNDPDSWDRFVLNCAAETEKSKVALLFDGVDEICPKYRANTVEFVNQASSKYPMVWISTRPQEKDNIKEQLGGQVKHLSIRPLQLNEAEKFLKRSLKGTNWRSAWQQLNKQLGREMPRTPMLLNMLARLIRSDEQNSSGIFGGTEALNIFSIYWHLVNLQIEDTADKDIPFYKNANLETKGTHLKVALRNISNDNVTGTITEDDVNTVNKVGFALIESGVLTFTHKTWEEFFLCLALMIFRGAEKGIHLKKDDKRILLTQPEHRQVRYFLDKALEIGFKDAAENEKFGVNRFLLEDGELRTLLKTPENSTTLLQNCCREGHFLIYKQLILQHLPEALELPGINVNELLLDACMSNEELAFDLINNRGAAVNAMFELCTDQVLLQLLVTMASKNFFKLLDTFPQNMSREALSTALFVALGNGYKDCAKVLQKLGADVELQDKGLNALHFVLGREMDNLSDVVSFLLDVLSDSQLNQKTDDANMTPLHLAAQTGRVDLVVKLLRKMAEKGVSTTDKDKDGWNYFHFAVVSKSEELVKYLLAEEGCDINAPTKNGCTPLHLAVRNGDPKMVSLLLSYGPDLRLKNGLNETAASCAQSNGQYESRDTILESQAIPMNQLNELYEPVQPISEI